MTGATGLVGTTLCDFLALAGYTVRVALHSECSVPSGVAEKVVIGDIGTAAALGAALEGVDAVIHAAARTHVLYDSPANAELYTQVNAGGTLRLAEAAAQAKVRRFVYLSSVKVNGEEAGRAYAPGDEPHPRDAYGVSKWLGETHLQEVAVRTGMSAVVVRPPLVYGPGVRANFLRLIRWADSGWLLPFGGIRNRRSFVSVWNLCDLLVRVLMHPGAMGRVWMVSDDDDLSTPELIRRLKGAMGRRPILLPAPVGLLRAAAGVMGRAAEIDRLCGSLFVDICQTRQELGWRPPVSVDEGLARTVRWYRTTR